MLRKMHRGIATVAIALPAIFAARLVCAATNVELIVDDSGSMAQHVIGGRKIDVAKQVLPGLIQDYARRRPNCGPDLRPPAPVARTRLL